MATAVRDPNRIPTLIGVDEATGTVATNVKVTAAGELLVNEGGISDYVTAIDEVDSSNTYIGQAAAGTATSASTWRIKKIVTSGTVTLISWASGVATFTKEWDERATYTYS